MCTLTLTPRCTFNVPEEFIKFDLEKTWHCCSCVIKWLKWNWSFVCSSRKSNCFWITIVIALILSGNIKSIPTHTHKSNSTPISNYSHISIEIFDKMQQLINAYTWSTTNKLYFNRTFRKRLSFQFINREIERIPNTKTWLNSIISEFNIEHKVHEQMQCRLFVELIADNCKKNNGQQLLAVRIIWLVLLLFPM